VECTFLKKKNISGLTRSMTLLHRPVVKDTAQQLETALAVADGASEYLVKVTRTAADNAAAEVLAGETLQEIMAGRLEMAPGSALDTLSQAVQAAQKFPNLKVRPRSKEKEEKGVCSYFSDHNGSLLRRQPRARPRSICLISSHQQKSKGLQCVLRQVASSFQGKDTAGLQTLPLLLLLQTALGSTDHA